MNMQAVINFNNCKTKEEKLKIILDSNDPNACYVFAFLFDDKESLNLLSEVILESGKEYYIEIFYKNFDFDKSKYESYFKNLIFK